MSLRRAERFGGCAAPRRHRGRRTEIRSASWRRTLDRTFLTNAPIARVFASLAGGGRVLNLFSYTCGFSVAAAAGARATTSVDVSSTVLAWGRHNFEWNGLAGEHRFVAEGKCVSRARAIDARGRAIRFRRPRSADVLDDEVSRFSSGKDYASLAAAALRLVAPRGRLLAVTNRRQTTHIQFRASTPRRRAHSGPASRADEGPVPSG